MSKNQDSWREPRETSRVVTPVHQARNARNLKGVALAGLLAGFIALPPYFYYKYVFQCHVLEEPTYELLVVRKDDPAEIAFFRKKTTPEYIDPALEALLEIARLQQSLTKGDINSKDCSARCRQIRSRLSDIMDAAKLRQIPSPLESRYLVVLRGIGEAYYSCEALDSASTCSDPETRASHLHRSIYLAQASRRKLSAKRLFFQGTKDV